ncbi:dockerin type I domain-containing protein [Ruminococcus sp.]|uniref:dockerin type I domain-containing protein n=1 Tax=Ruminococcus sp. TaxID=41978 RepID=UPI002C9E13DD|nr:dockerin type I domain-containing protein [Ruminococcus sp.]HOH87742.1 dockerin type I domain-containing protein [Ruminococcus sp.]
MRGKAMGTGIIAALMLSSALTVFPVNAVSEADRGTLTVTIIDEETNEMFAEDRDCFSIIGGSIHLSSWNPSKSNPHTVTDVQTAFDYVVQYTAKDYDGYTYYIDTEKGEPMISFADVTDKEVTVYMKKNNWGSSDTTAPGTPVSTELKTFEELYAAEENELKQYCSDHKLNYISKEEAENQLANKCGINIMVKPKDYLLKADDLLESEDLSAFNKSNFSDYDFDKMVSDLNLPEKYYKFNADKNNFAFYSESKPDANGDPGQIFYKLAQINVQPDPSVANERSLARLYQLAGILAEQNPIVHSISLVKAGSSPDTAEEAKSGDVNSDGEFNISDVVLLQKWLLAVPDTHLENWKAADLCDDDILDVFDLCLMKKALIEKMNEVPQNADTTFKFQSVTDVRYNDDNHTKWTGFVARSENDLINILTENEGVSADKASIEGIDSNTFKDKSIVIVYSICTAGNSYSIIDNISVNGNGIDVSTTSKKPMIATPDMLFRRYVYLIDKNAVTNVNSFNYTDESSYYQYDEGNEVTEWFKEWCQAQ